MSCTNDDFTALRTRDPDAWRRVEAHLRHAIRRYDLPEATKEDIVQDVLGTLLDHIDSGADAEISNPCAYWAQAARFRAIDAWRRRTRTADDEPAERARKAHEGGHLEPEDHLEADLDPDLRERLERAVTQATARDRVDVRATRREHARYLLDRALDGTTYEALLTAREPHLTGEDRERRLNAISKGGTAVVRAVERYGRWAMTTLSAQGTGRLTAEEWSQVLAALQRLIRRRRTRN